MFGAEHPGIPTASVPGVIGFTHHLGDFPGGIVAGVVFKSINAIMNTGLCAGLLEIGDSGSIVAFHVMTDGKLVTIARSVPVTCIGLPPDGWAIVRTGVGRGSAGDDSCC